MNDLANAPLSAPEIPVPSNEGDSLRDTLTKAIETARTDAPAAGNDAPKPGAPAAQVKPSLDKPADLRAGEQPRGPDGKFAPVTPQATPVTPAAAKPGETAAAPPQAAAAPTFKAPVGWNPAAKAQFDALPAEVREAVAKREEEVNRGFEVLQRYKGLDEFQPYIDRAQTTHAEVMRRAVEWERSLQTRPLDTIRHVVGLTGLDPRLIAHALLNPNAQIPQQQQPQPRPQPVDIAAEVDKVLNQRETLSSVEKFMADPKNEHVETVAPQMAVLIQHARSIGQPITLEEAYQQAIWAHPQIRETLISQRLAPPASSDGARQQQVANQARQAAKAITGAPSGGRAPPPGPPNADTVRDAIMGAINAQR